MSLRLLGDHDLGFILKGGEWIVQNQQFPSHDTYTYTVNQNEYINSHWLFHVFAYSIWSVFGYSGLSIFTAILVSSVFVVLLRTVKAHAKIFVVIWIILLSLFATEFRFNLRPELITWLCISFFCWIISKYENDKSKLLFWLIPIQLFWVNSHGLFILGWGIFGAYFLYVYLIKKQKDKRILQVLAALLAVSFINPYGLKGVMFPFYLFTRLQESNVMNNEISEFTSPLEVSAENPLTLFLFSFYALLVLGFISTLLTKEKFKAFQLFIMVVFAWLAFKAIRNIPLFVVVTIPFAINNISSLGITNRISDRLQKKWSKTVYVLHITLLLGFVLLLIDNGYYFLQNRPMKMGVGIDNTIQSVTCSEFMIANEING